MKEIQKLKRLVGAMLIDAPSEEAKQMLNKANLAFKALEKKLQSSMNSSQKKEPDTSTAKDVIETRIVENYIFKLLQEGSVALPGGSVIYAKNGAIHYEVSSGEQGYSINDYETLEETIRNNLKSVAKSEKTLSALSIPLTSTERIDWIGGSKR